jgi:hypothetical protein
MYEADNLIFKKKHSKSLLIYIESAFTFAKLCGKATKMEEANL